MLELPTPRPRRFALLGLAALFVVAGANHFVSTEFYVGIMPAYFPLHLQLVYLSGLLEMLGGAAEATSAPGGWPVVPVVGSPANCTAGRGQCGDRKVLALNSTPEPRKFGGLFGECQLGRVGPAPLIHCSHRS